MRRLKTTIWVGGGSSNDYIARTLHDAVPALKPNLVLVLFTYASRREYVDEKRRVLQIMPGTVDRPEYNAFVTLQNDWADFENFYRNLVMVNLILNHHQVPWLFATLERSHKRYRVLNWANFLDYHVEVLDHARDMCHAGKKSLETFADKMFEKFLNMDYPSSERRNLDTEISSTKL